MYQYIFRDCFSVMLVITSLQTQKGGSYYLPKQILFCFYWETADCTWEKFLQIDSEKEP